MLVESLRVLPGITITAGHGHRDEGLCCVGFTEIKKHAQQDSHITAKTPINAESAGNGSSSNRSQDLNLDQIKSMLASIDPTILKQLLVEILKE
tara:strand:+ start:320 stop:601 length:282 start_codon:yes stop_codon:yes gene_type:complete